jgi:hypothetical protein
MYSDETFLLRDWIPPPHELLQMLQLSHSDTAQSTGHENELHSRDLLSLPHFLPP